MIKTADSWHAISQFFYPGHYRFETFREPVPESFRAFGQGLDRAAAMQGVSVKRGRPGFSDRVRTALQEAGLSLETPWARHLLGDREMDQIDYRDIGNINPPIP